MSSILQAYARTLTPLCGLLLPYIQGYFFCGFVESVSKKKQYQLRVLRGVKKQLYLGKRKITHSTFAHCQFRYAALIWLFCKEKHILKLRKLNHRSLMAIYHSDEPRKILLESRVSAYHFNTSKASMVTLNLFDLISVVTGSFRYNKAHSSLFMCASTY